MAGVFFWNTQSGIGATVIVVEVLEPGTRAGGATGIGGAAVGKVCAEANPTSRCAPTGLCDAMQRVARSRSARSFTNERRPEPPAMLGNATQRSLVRSVQRHRFTGTIKSLPARMFRIRFEISHFDHHPVRFAVAVGADLSADPPPRCVKGTAADFPKWSTYC